MAYGCWTRSECFKVERGILTFGLVLSFESYIIFLYIHISYYSWSRWPEIILHNDFREGWKESDVEDLARIVVSIVVRQLRNLKSNLLFYLYILDFVLFAFLSRG